jgi:rhomboid protease GluP
MQGHGNEMGNRSGSGYSAMSSGPEILPPEGRAPSGWYPPPGSYSEPPPESYRVPPQSERPRRRGAWAFAPATYVLLGINIAVFLGMLLNRVSILDPTTDQLLRWGANCGPYVLIGGQWWRLFTAMFVHVGIIHIATNMWCLWNLGLLAEPLIGPMGVVAAYVLTGFAGNLLSVAVHPGVPGGPEGIVGAGASGAIFGLAGVLILLLKSPLLPIPKEELKKLRWSVIQFSILNFGIGLYTAFGRSPVQIDNMAHLGGFLSGLAFGIPLVPRIGAAKDLFERRRILAVLGMGFLLVLLAFGLHSFWR